MQVQAVAPRQMIGRTIQPNESVVCLRASMLDIVNHLLYDQDHTVHWLIEWPWYFDIWVKSIGEWPAQKCGRPSVLG